MQQYVWPATGAVELSIASEGTVGGAKPVKALQVAGNDGTDVRVLKTDAAGELQVDVVSSALPAGAATSAKQDTAAAILTTIDADTGTMAGLLATIDADTGSIATSSASTATYTGDTANTVASIDTKTPALVSGRVPVDGSGVTQPVSGTFWQATQPISAAALPAATGRTYADSIRYAYSSGAVALVTWVQLIASTAAAINKLHIFDSSGQTLELGVGGSGSEARKLIIPPGGFNEGVDLNIPAGSRIAIRALSATTGAIGEINITGLT